MNFSVGVTLKINLSPRHIRSGTVLKYIREDGDGRERTEMRPLGGAGRVIWHVPTALPHLTQPGQPRHTPPHAPAGLPRPRTGCWHEAEALKCWSTQHVTTCALSHLSPPREHGASTGRTSHQHTAQGLPPFHVWFPSKASHMSTAYSTPSSFQGDFTPASSFAGVEYSIGMATQQMKYSQVPARCAGHYGKRKSLIQKGQKTTKKFKIVCFFSLNRKE